MGGMITRPMSSRFWVHTVIQQNAEIYWKGSGNQPRAGQMPVATYLVITSALKWIMNWGIAIIVGPGPTEKGKPVWLPDGRRGRGKYGKEPHFIPTDKSGGFRAEYLVRRKHGHCKDDD